LQKVKSYFLPISIILRLNLIMFETLKPPSDLPHSVHAHFLGSKSYDTPVLVSGAPVPQLSLTGSYFTDSGVCGGVPAGVGFWCA
jgi:hypothetical protein